MTELASSLLIDDETFFAEPLVDAFRDEGLELDVAATWNEGLERFIAVNYELVIADFDLDEAQTGLLLLAEIRKLAPSTHLILISGRIDSAGGPLVDQAGVADVYMEKTDPRLREVLLAEARAAQLRAAATDWAAEARALPRAAEVDTVRIAELQTRLQGQHSRPKS